MAVELTRRHLLTVGVLSAMETVIGKLPATSADSRLSFFAGQSGRPDDGLICLTILATPNPLRYEQALLYYRSAHKHRRTLTPRSRDKYAAKFCEQFIDIAFDDNMRCASTIVSLNKWPDNAYERDAIVYAYHARALDAARAKGIGAIEINFALRDNSLQMRQLAATLSNYSAPAPSIGFRMVGEKLSSAPWKRENLVQVAGYLAHAVRYPHSGGEAKRAFREYIMAKLNVQSLYDNSLKNHRYFSVEQIVI